MALGLLMFDLDGTLIDSAGDITRALNFALGAFTEYRATEEETKAMVGEGVSRLFDKLLASKGILLEKPLLLARFIDFYSAHPVDLSRPYEGVRETLTALKAYKKVVVTNKLQAVSVKTLDALGLLGHFEYVVGGDNVAERKPSPLPLLETVERFGLQPREAMMVGDSIYDIEAGRAAGIVTVAVTYGYGASGFAREAHFVIDRFSQVAEIVRTVDGGRR